MRAVLTLAMSWAALPAALLGERVGRREALCLAASVVGVLLVVRPAAVGALSAHGTGGAAIPLGATGVALLGSLGRAGKYVVVRALGAAEPAARVTRYLPRASGCCCWR